MALTQIGRRRPAVATPTRRSALRRNRQTGPRDQSLEGLTAGALYDLALHGHKGAMKALTGAAVEVTAPNAMDVRRLVQPWQARSMSYYDMVPEVKFAARFMGALMSRVRLFPAMMDDETNEPEEITDTANPVYKEFQRIQDRNGERAQLQQSYGTLRFLISEGYLTVSPDEMRGEVWEFLSPNELRVQPGGIATRFRAPMLAADQYRIAQIRSDYIIGNDPTTVETYGEVLNVGTNAQVFGPAFTEHGMDVISVWRLWRQHPAYSFLADSNMMASLDLLEELVLSTYSVRAQLKSRLNQGGLLAMPEEMSFPSLGNNPDEDPNSDLFQERLTSAIMAAIGDPGSASAFSPLVVQMAGEFIKDIKLIRFNDSQGELAEIAQRGEMIERFGVGAELPPELFSSKADINHWGTWFVDEDTWKSYGDPASREMASDICAAFLQPAMMKKEGVDWTKVRIGVDPSEVIYHPNRAADAAALYQARCLSKKVYLEALGYNENDLPPQDELNEQLGVAIKDGSLAVYGIPAVRANIEPAAGEVEGAPGNGGVANPSTGGPNQPGAPERVDKEPGAEQDKPAGGPGVSGTNAGPAVTASADPRAGRVLALADAAVRRGRELAGSRLRSMTTGRNAKRCSECAEAIAGKQTWEVPYALGDERITALFGPVTHDLVDGTGHWLASMLREQGVAEQWAVDIGALVQQHTAGTLYQETPAGFPPAFQRLLSRLDLPREQATTPADRA